MNNQKPLKLFNSAVVIAALGYFVDIYDLLLFTIVRVPSLNSIGVTDANMVAASAQVLNYQMVGLLLGGILWGSLADKKGRLSVLYGSILLYSIANFATGFVQTVDQYAWIRFIAGIGLAGELGAGITLVSELLPKNKRGIGTSLVAGIGLSGAVFAWITFKLTNDWRLCFKIGGVLGIVLLLLRIKVAESGMFNEVKTAGVSRGNFLLFFSQGKRFKKYLLAILIGLPTWFVIGILINFSNNFAGELYNGKALVDSGTSIMFAYIAISVGDVAIGFVSQYFKSRKKALLLFYSITIVGITLFLSPLNNSPSLTYMFCALLGFGTGFWAIFVTMGAEQFGTNLRATAATTIPNMVRGSLPLISFLFKDFFYTQQKMSYSQAAIYTGSLVMIISLVALYFTEETFYKDLNYLEK
jgi:MFS transporter, putative metabolite:H+ symporter